MGIVPQSVASIARVRLVPSLSIVAASCELPTGRSASNGADLAGSTANIGGLWEDLAAGRVAIAKQQLDANFIHLFLRPGSRPSRELYDRSKVETLKRVLTGSQQKVMALELRISASTISSRVRSALASFGTHGPLRQTPVGLAMLASAHQLGPGFMAPGYQLTPASTGAELALSMPRPELALRARLTPVELEVARAIMIGASHRQVGAERDRSARTIANQLHSISAKLGTSGRFGFIRLAVAITGGLERESGAAVL